MNEFGPKGMECRGMDSINLLEDVEKCLAIVNIGFKKNAGLLLKNPDRWRESVS